MGAGGIGESASAQLGFLLLGGGDKDRDCTESAQGPFQGPFQGPDRRLSAGVTKLGHACAVSQATPPT